MFVCETDWQARPVGRPYVSVRGSAAIDTDHHIRHWGRHPPPFKGGTLVAVVCHPGE